MMRFVWALAILCAACGHTASTSCGAGAIEVDGQCVPDPNALACGAGTVADGGVCYPANGGPDATADEVGGLDASDSGEVADALVGDIPCQPNCAGKQCGDDGCGGTCGACASAAAPICNSIGVCVASCTAECTGKTCGDDGCGGVCGMCGTDSGCSSIGQCVPKAWTCNALYFGAGDACDCACGGYDPDCKDPEAPLAGCGSLQKCDAAGKCVDKNPAGWTCAPTSYDALDGCDCGCGVPDPDCAVATLPVIGCKTGEACSTAGACVACVPACNGKNCGPDGCGGSCGSCGEGAVCDAGTCADPCKPTPIACKYATCGDDGCGGSCGTCAAGKTCDGGTCVVVGLPEAPTSCVGHCGSTALSGCSCAPKCVANGTCCDDYSAVCTCKPDCTGKACGPNGCGGTCGTCGGNAPWCDATGQCSATCTKQCTGKACGDDGCGGTCGQCGADSVCSTYSQCVPTAWQCPIPYFADGIACDCGCGAPDPDCAIAKVLTFGCPTSTTACDATTGLCKSTFCKSDTTCGSQACVGLYATGGGGYGGVCGAQTSGGKNMGQLCASAGECKSSVCLGGLCRQFCQTDGECPGQLKCLALPVTGPANAVVGLTGVCEAVNGSGGACTKQADCTAFGESCQAFADAKTFQPRYLCAIGSKTSGAKCGLQACGAGQFCVADSAGKHCGAACPGGSSDCTSGTCGTTTFNNAGTNAPADDPKVPVCVQP